MTTAIMESAPNTARMKTALWILHCSQLNGTPDEPTSDAQCAQLLASLDGLINKCCTITSIEHMYQPGWANLSEASTTATFVMDGSDAASADLEAEISQDDSEHLLDSGRASRDTSSFCTKFDRPSAVANHTKLVRQSTATLQPQLYQADSGTCEPEANISLDDTAENEDAKNQSDAKHGIDALENEGKQGSAGTDPGAGRNVEAADPGGSGLPAQNDSTSSATALTQAAAHTASEVDSFQTLIDEWDRVGTFFSTGTQTDLRPWLASQGEPFWLFKLADGQSANTEEDNNTFQQSAVDFSEAGISDGSICGEAASANRGHNAYALTPEASEAAALVEADMQEASSASITEGNNTLQQSAVDFR